MTHQPINFLPADYVQQRTRRYRLYRRSILLVLAVACLCGWWYTQNHRTQALRDYAAFMEEQVEDARTQIDQMKTLQQELRTLNKQQRIHDELALPVSHTQIMATISELMPDTVGLVNMEMTTHRPAPTGKENDASPGRRGTRQASSGTSASAERNELEIRLRGVAPDDMAVANFAAALNDHTLFSAVTIHASRSTQYRDMYARDFQLSLVIRLDRNLQIMPAGGEVAHAE